MPWQNRANVKSVVPPVFGKTPALMGAATPCPNNGGHPPGPTAPVQPGAPRRLGRRVTDACTCRALSWLSLTAYCFSSSPFSYGGSILYPQKNVKTVIFIEKRGADDRSPFVFDLFYITACWNGSRCPASPRWRSAHRGTWDERCSPASPPAPMWNSPPDSRRRTR